MSRWTIVYEVVVDADNEEDAMLTANALIMSGNIDPTEITEEDDNG